MTTKEKQVLKNFLKTKYFQKNILSEYLKNKDIVFIYLGGSRLLNFNNINSDYDLIIVFNGTDCDEDKPYLNRRGHCIEFCYQNISINYIYQNINYFYTFDLEKDPLCTAEYCIFENIQEKDIIYKNPKYYDFINYFLYDKKWKKIQKEISYLGITTEKNIIKKFNYIFPKAIYKSYYEITKDNKKKFNKKIALKIKNKEILNQKENLYLKEIFNNYFNLNQNISIDDIQNKVIMINHLLQKKIRKISKENTNETI